MLTDYYQRIIIFDGPDGTGKTNIAQGLRDRTNIPYFKFSGEADYWRKEQFRTALDFDQPFMLEYLKQTKVNLIWDRAWPSEWVYSRVFNRETNKILLERLDAEYAKLGTWIVIPLRVDYSKNEKDDLVPPEKLQELHFGYNDFCKWTACNTLRIYVDTFQNHLLSELDAIASIVMAEPNEFKQDIIVENKRCA